MNRIEVRLTVFILAVVLGVTAWMKLRHTDKEVYDNPARWSVEEHPAFKKDQ